MEVVVTLFFSIVIAAAAIFVVFKVLRTIMRVVTVFSLVIIAVAAVVYFAPSLLAFVR